MAPKRKAAARPSPRVSSGDDGRPSPRKKKPPPPASTTETAADADAVASVDDAEMLPDPVPLETFMRSVEFQTHVRDGHLQKALDVAATGPVVCSTLLVQTDSPSMLHAWVASLRNTDAETLQYRLLCVLECSGAFSHESVNALTAKGRNKLFRTTSVSRMRLELFLKACQYVDWSGTAATDLVDWLPAYVSESSVRCRLESNTAAIVQELPEIALSARVFAMCASMLHIEASRILLTRAPLISLAVRDMLVRDPQSLQIQDFVGYNDGTEAHYTQEAQDRRPKIMELLGAAERYSKWYVAALPSRLKETLSPYGFPDVIHDVFGSYLLPVASASVAGHEDANVKDDCLLTTYMGTAEFQCLVRQGRFNEALQVARRPGVSSVDCSRVVIDAHPFTTVLQLWADAVGFKDCVLRASDVGALFDVLRDNGGLTSEIVNCKTADGRSLLRVVQGFEAITMLISRVCHLLDWSDDDNVHVLLRKFPDSSDVADWDREMPLTMSHLPDSCIRADMFLVAARSVNVEACRAMLSRNAWCAPVECPEPKAIFDTETTIRRFQSIAPARFQTIDAMVRAAKAYLKAGLPVALAKALHVSFSRAPVSSCQGALSASELLTLIADYLLVGF